MSDGKIRPMWEELGIPETVEMRSIRKAYAARLKALNRVADDEAFARLHAAYQQAIAWAERAARTSEAPSSSEVIYLKPAPPPAQPPTPDSMAFQELGVRIELLLEEGKFQDAVDAYDQGLARGILPLGSDGPYLDKIMEIAVRTLAPEPFAALMHRVGWDNPPRLRSWYTPVRQAADHRLEAETWYRNIRREAALDGKRSPVQATTILSRMQQALQRRYQRRNARLLLVDRPQIVRINKATIKDLQGKMAFYQRYQSWLAPRFPERAIQRVQWMLDYETNRGKSLRKVLGWLVALLIFGGIGGVWGGRAAIESLYVTAVIFWIIFAVNSCYRLLKRWKPAWAAWLSNQGTRIFGTAVGLLMFGFAFLRLMNWIDGNKEGIFSGPFPWMLLGLFFVMFLSGVNKTRRR